MKVLVVSNMYPDKKSYFGIFIQKQLESLKQIKIETIQVVKNKNSLFAYIPFIFRSIVSLLFRSYDIVHAHYGFHSALLPALIHKKPLIITFHGSDALKEPYRNKVYYFLQSYVVKRADHLIAVSNEIKNELLSFSKINPNKISIISCGVDSNQFLPLNQNEVRQKLGLSEKFRIVLYVGTVNYMKGIDLICESAKVLSDFLFIFIGNGKFKAPTKNCVFYGSRAHDEMPLWMNAADILVLPSRSEGAPLVLLEALSCGTPVISSNVGGCPDLIKDGLTGYLVKTDDVTMLQNRIKYLLVNDRDRNEMKNQCRTEVTKKYDNIIIARKMYRIYRNAADYQIQ